MEALTIFMMLMAILAGMIGMGSLARLLRHHGSTAAVWAYRCLLLFNLLLVVGLGSRYLEYHGSESLAELPYALLQLVLLDILVLIKLAFLFSLARTGASLTRGPADPAPGKIALATGSAAGLGVILFSAAAFGLGRGEAAFGAHGAFEVILIAALIGVALHYGLVRRGRDAGTIRRRAAFRFCLLQSGFFVWVMTGLFLQRMVPQLGSTLLSAATMFFYNVLLVLWAHRYLPVLDATGAARGEAKEHLLREFGITRREEEVIRLICEGKSNREIAEQLFISVDTVKDHNHNIFRKTGVGNRVQLANLFRLGRSPRQSVP